MATNSKSNELRLTRVYDAPVQAVWDAWTDLEKVGQWWGPRGFTITTHSKDLRPGGTWVYTMHGPDGVDYPNITHYYEVEERAKLVYDHGASEGKPPLFRVTVLFSELNGKTTLDMTMRLETPEAAAETRKFIKKAGGEGTWDRLAEYLEKNSSGKDVFVINRSFDVPVERMFEMWTDPKHFSRWLPPEGVQMEVLRGDIRPGRTTFSRMFAPGLEFWVKFEYGEIAPHRITYTQRFCDEAGGPSRHPMAPWWPEAVRAEVTFAPEGPEQTRVTLRWEPDGKITPEELAFFVKERGGVTKGWTASFDKLEALLTPAQAAMG